MDELNEKLAEWAGIKETYSDGWYFNGEKVGDLPDFTHDMKACFDILVPTLWAQGFDYELYGWMGNEHKSLIVSRTGHAVEYLSEAVEKKAAMAFCKAIEKVVS